MSEEGRGFGSLSSGFCSDSAGSVTSPSVPGGTLDRTPAVCGAWRRVVTCGLSLIEKQPGSPPWDHVHAVPLMYVGAVILGEMLQMTLSTALRTAGAVHALKTVSEVSHGLVQVVAASHSGRSRTSWLASRGK